VRTLTLLLTATLIVLAGTLALVEPGFNVIPMGSIRCAREAAGYSYPACLDERRGAPIVDEP